MNFKKIILFASCFSLIVISAESNFIYQGELGVETRFFSNDDQDQTEDTNVSPVFRAELYNTHGNYQEKIRGFIRKGLVDDSRDSVILEEAWVGMLTYPFQVRLGYQLLTWTALEAFHPADILNSRNYDSNIENAEKFGELMLNVTYLMDYGSLSAYIMPTVVNPNFPETSNRLSYGFDAGTPKWVSPDDSIHNDGTFLQGGVRLDRILGDADVSVHLIHHQDRSQPVFLSVENTLTPFYLPVTQLGGTVQYIFHDFIIKSEWAYRDFDKAEDTSYGDIDQVDHLQLALGTEYTFYHLSGRETTVIAEVQRYEGGGVDDASLGVFQNDFLLGYRYVFNDIQSREFFTSIIVDLEEDEFLFSSRYEQRIKDRWKIRTGVRIYDGGLFEDSDHIFIEGSQYF